MTTYPRKHWIILDSGAKVVWHATSAREAVETFLLAYPNSVVQDVMNNGMLLIERNRWQ